MKEISRLYEGRLVLVSLSIDDKTNWEIASRHHDICWWNLNDLKGNHGLYAKYSSGLFPAMCFYHQRERLWKCGPVTAKEVC